ncbi:hypothetical protein Clacol_010262 [Clathrus columnatus]|uniref:BTB domain-containing protein n=1 Tax=Clathrus columnatus TaxID=1419009 RepID=A0AAV5ASJ9_9AGAM|nr:hypothetical protein Clacol_010262 [Clathrus columnatus]
MSDITEEDSSSSLFSPSDCHSHSLVRDPEYYFEDGNVVILVQNVLFKVIKVHKSRLSKDSSTFEAMFGLPPETERVAEGFDDDNPVVLGDTSGQFRIVNLVRPHEIIKASTPGAGHDWSAFERFCDLAQMVHKYCFRSTEAWVLSTFVQWLKPTRLIPPRISTTATTGLNSNGTATALNRSSEHMAVADKVLLERLRRILELSVLCEETELHNAIVQRLQEELGLPNADLPWFIMLGEHHNIPTLTGTAYYALMVQGQDRWIALTKEGTLSNPQLSKLHYGYYALVSLWEKYRTMPPVIPSCTHYGHNCRQRWQTYWKDLMKDDHIMAKFPADVLGRLEMVLSQLYSYNGIMDMHQECRSLAVSTIKNMLSEAKMNLASNFELSV